MMATKDLTNLQVPKDLEGRKIRVVFPVQIFMNQSPRHLCLRKNLSNSKKW